MFVQYEKFAGIVARTPTVRSAVKGVRFGPVAAPTVCVMTQVSRPSVSCRGHEYAACGWNETTADVLERQNHGAAS